MNNFLKRAIAEIVIFSVVAAILHVYLIKNYLPPSYGSGPYWSIYALLVPVTLLTVYITSSRYKKDRTAAGKTYFALMIIKMIIVLLYFSVFLFPKTPFSAPLVHQFFCLFFPLLFIELKLLMKLLNKPLDEI